MIDCVIGLSDQVRAEVICLEGISGAEHSRFKIEITSALFVHTSYIIPIVSSAPIHRRSSLAAKR